MLYELGIKSGWFDNRLRTNVAIYFNKFDDLQQLATNTQRDLGVAGTFVQNAGTLEHYGFEADYAAQPNNWLTLSGAVAYLHSEYTDFDGAPCPNPSTYSDLPPSPTTPGSCDQTGFRAPFTPEWRANQTVRLTFPLVSELEWWLQGSAIYTDSQFLDASRDRRGYQDSYTLFDVAVGVGPRDGKWQATAFLKNATDEEYVVSGLAGPSLAAFQGLGSASYVAYLGAPQTFAASIQYNF